MRSIGSQPRREFLKLAALTGAAAFAANESTAEMTSPTSSPSVARAIDPKQQKMSFLGVKGRDIVDSKGKKVRLRGTCPQIDPVLNAKSMSQVLIDAGKAPMQSCYASMRDC